MLEDISKQSENNTIGHHTGTPDSTEPQSSTSESSVRKKRKINIYDTFNDRSSSIVESNSSSKTVYELNLYKSLEFDGKTNESVLEWWKRNRNVLPLLSELARLIFSIPASSAAPESCFSNAGFLINEKRTRLSPSLVEDILVSHGNKDLLKCWSL